MEKETLLKANEIMAKIEQCEDVLKSFEIPNPHSNMENNLPMIIDLKPTIIIEHLDVEDLLESNIQTKVPGQMSKTLRDVIEKHVIALKNGYEDQLKELK